jgi:hypothetical protein
MGVVLDSQAKGKTQSYDAPKQNAELICTVDGENQV